MFVRLDDRNRERILKAGGGAFEPMVGRPMKEYVVLPERWRLAEIELIREYALHALRHAKELPPKASKKKPTKKKL